MQPLYFLLILIIPCVLLMMSLQAPSWFPTWDFNFYLTDGSEGCRWGDESVASFPPAMSQQRQQHQHYDQLFFCSSLPGNSSTCLPASHRPGHFPFRAAMWWESSKNSLLPADFTGVSIQNLKFVYTDHGYYCGDRLELRCDSVFEWLPSKMLLCKLWENMQKWLN